MTDTTMNTGAASLSDEQRIAIEAAISISEDIEAERHDGSFLSAESVQALRALLAPTPQADAAPIINGHAVNDLFLKWSEWTTELGEAISRKNIDGFVSELRAAIAAGGAQEPVAHIQALVDAAKNVFELANHFNVSGVYFTEDDENRDALQALEDRIEAVDRSRS